MGRRPAPQPWMPHHEQRPRLDLLVDLRHVCRDHPQAHQDGPAHDQGGENGGRKAIDCRTPRPVPEGLYAQERGEAGGGEA